MAIPASMVLGARQEAEAAKRAARPDAQVAPARHGLWIGIVTAVQANNTYQVKVTDDSNGELATYEFVRIVPPTASLSVDSVVWLVLQEGAAVPVIMGGASGGGGDDCGVVVD